MREEIEEFETYLRTVKRSSNNTVAAYIRDLEKMKNFMNEQGRQEITDITATNLTTYALYMDGSAAVCCLYALLYVRNLKRKENGYGSRFLFDMGQL